MRQRSPLTSEEDGARRVRIARKASRALGAAAGGDELADRLEGVEWEPERDDSVGMPAAPATIPPDSHAFAGVHDDLDEAPIVGASEAALRAFWTPERLFAQMMRSWLREREKLERERRKMDRRAEKLRREWQAADAARERIVAKSKQGPFDFETVDAAHRRVGRAFRLYDQARYDAANRGPVVQARIAALTTAIEDRRAELMPVLRAAVAGTSAEWRHREGRVFDQKGRTLTLYPKERYRAFTV